MKKTRVRHGTLTGFRAPEGQCLGKEGFANGALAHRTAVRMLAKYKNRKGSVDVYRCPHCGKYHIGRS